MSQKKIRKTALARRNYATIFAALGDETRLSLVTRLSSGLPSSIAQLSKGSNITRQAIAKHLRVLESAGIVHSVRSGRMSLCKLDPEPINEIKKYLDIVSHQWDQALSRLKHFVEG